MKIKVRKSLWRFSRNQPPMSEGEAADALQPVGNSIVQAAYSASVLREDRGDHAPDAL